MNELLHSYGIIYSDKESRLLLKTLIKEIEWQTEFIAYDRRFELPRHQAWYADKGVHYRQSENKMHTRSWTATLKTIKQSIELFSNHQFNSVLLTYYRNGNDHVGWHADDEMELGDAPVIASLSLGMTRQFHFRHKHTGESASIPLHNAELLVMQPGFQRNWEHSIQPETEITKSRVNLTFRHVITPT